MKLLMNGWPECCSDEDPTFEGIALIYYKRNGIVQLEEIRDFGTTVWKAKRINHLMELNPEATLYNPSQECRCLLISTDSEIANRDVFTTFPTKKNFIILVGGKQDR
jgi:hypothetical protein